MRVSEIRVNQIRVNQGLSVLQIGGFEKITFLIHKIPKSQIQKSFFFFFHPK